MSSNNVLSFPQQDITIGGPVHDASVSLCIYGDELDPDEITQLLGQSPPRSHRRGDRLKPSGPSFRTGAWIYQVESEVAPDAPELVLVHLLDRLPSDPAFWTQLGQRYDIRISICIGFEGWNKGFTLSTRNIQRVAALGTRMDFDLYASENMPPEFDDSTTT